MPSSTKSSTSTSSGVFSRFGLTNPFASDKTATGDKNSRRKSSTTLLSSTSLSSPAFKMTKKLRSRKDSGGNANASTTSLAMPESGAGNTYPCAGGSVERSEEAGGRPGSRASGFSLKRTPSTASLGKMLGDRLKKATGGKAKTNSGKAPEGGERSESRASSNGGGGGLGLTRSNAVSSRPHSRKSSWRNSWAGGVTLGLTTTTTTDSASGSTSNRHSANSTASHVSFASTDATDASEGNKVEVAGGGIKGFRRRKTSSTLQGLVPGRGMGLGLGGSGLEMTPAPAAAATAKDGEDVANKKPPNTSDGVLATTNAPTDGTPAAVAADNSKSNEETEQQQQSTQRLADRGHKKSSSTDTLTRRIKLNRTKRDPSSPTSRARSKSDSAGSLLATPSKLLAIRRRPSLHTATTSASTTALRAPSTSSESGMSLPSAVAAANSGFAGFIGHPAGVTALSSPNLLLFDSSGNANGASGSGGRAIVDAGDRFTAAWCSAGGGGGARDPPPMLPELPAGGGGLLGEFEMPRIECVEGADGRTGWVDLRTGRRLEGVGDGALGVTEEARRDGGRMAVQRVLENRKRVVVASDRMDSGDDGAESDDEPVGGREAEGRDKGAVNDEVGGQLVLARKNSAASSLVGDGRDPSASSRSVTPRPNSAQSVAARELGVRGRATFVDSNRLHDKVLPSSSSSVYSTPGTSPPTSSGTPVPPENDYVKDIETEIVDDRWVDYGPMNEIRMLEL